MSAVVTELDQAGAIIGIARFAARAGLPLPRELHATLEGTGEDARAIFAEAQRLLGGAGVRFTREDSASFQVLVIHGDAGITYRIVHARETPLTAAVEGGVA